MVEAKLEPSDLTTKRTLFLVTAAISAYWFSPPQLTQRSRKVSKDRVEDFKPGQCRSYVLFVKSRLEMAKYLLLLDIDAHLEHTPAVGYARISA
jgi:hypothetical protein